MVVPALTRSTASLPSGREALIDKRKDRGEKAQATHRDREDTKVGSNPTDRYVPSVVMAECSSLAASGTVESCCTDGERADAPDLLCPLTVGCQDGLDVPEALLFGGGDDFER